MATEHREWWIDAGGYLCTPAGTRVARRAGDNLLFADPATGREVPMCAADWERIFAILEPEQAPTAATITCHCGETLTVRDGVRCECPVCGRVWALTGLAWARALRLDPPVAKRIADGFISRIATQAGVSTSVAEALMGTQAQDGGAS